MKSQYFTNNEMELACFCKNSWFCRRFK